MINRSKEFLFKTLGVVLAVASIGAGSAMMLGDEYIPFSSVNQPISKKIIKPEAKVDEPEKIADIQTSGKGQSDIQDIVSDTTDLPWPNTDTNYPQENTSGISLPLPDNIKYHVEYDPITGQYYMVQTIGDNFNYRYPSKMTMEEYMKYDFNKNLSEYWQKQQANSTAENSEFAPKLDVGGEGFKNIFGSNEIEIRPQGSAEITFGVNISKTENPRIAVKQQRISTFNFDQKIQLNVIGNIGTKMKLTTNFNTEATFDFENQMKLEYTGDEDEIIKKIEAGNVSLPLKGTLITGSQSLFGLKLETQWGKLRNTTVLSQQKGERKEIEVSGGAQTQTYDIKADSYDANRHFFLSHWFRDQYDNALASLPIVNSGVNITRIEVYVVNTQANVQDVRNIIAFTDLGENPSYISSDLPTNQLTDGPELNITNQPSNSNNDIYYDMVNNPEVMSFNGAVAAISAMGLGYQQGKHYERVGNARKLTASEFSYNSKLGFISLRQSLNNAEVLAVAYEYTLGGQTYKVGTLSLDGFTPPNALILKMLKSSVTDVQSPLWDLMMKNIYNIGAYGVQKDKFRLDVWYDNPAIGIPQNYIDRDPLKGKLLIQVLNMDKLDGNNIPHPDGIFDYIDNAATQGGTINSQDGRVFFPVVEPFGEHLANKISEGLSNPAEAEAIIQSVVFQELYDSTKTAAQQIPSKNRFSIRGQYQSASGSEIALNALNIPRGSVAVTAGGVKLTEGQDYTVDYNLGRVRIINDGILQSGTPIKISLESQSLFSFQSKVLLGSRFDYEVNDHLKFGGTIMNMRERPLTQKVNIGDEPVNNTILGVDMGFQQPAPFITRWVDKLPFLETKAESKIDFSAEAAYFIPGHSKAIGKSGNAYIDDFEGSQSSIDLRSIRQWYLASTPKLQPNLFPEGNLEDSLIFNYNKALLSWYIIDPTVFLRGSNITPPGIDENVRSDHRMREILEAEVFPNKQLPPGVPANISTLDLTFYPNERGQNNYELFNGSPLSSGLNPDGTLRDPATRWGGIQRALTTTDFEASNIEYIQFWLMDPFNEDSPNTTGGQLYFNLGSISEDVLNDSQLSYENGLPTDNNPLPTLTSTWGVYPDPANFNVVNAFDNSGGYEQQDLGLDGMNDSDEQNFFSAWLSDLQGNLTNEAFQKFNSDPTGDNYVYFRSPEADNANLNTLQRYKYFNGYQGNSNTSSPNGYSTATSTIPNTEDISQDLTLNTTESYFQYKIDITPEAMGGENSVGNNYITDSFVAEVDNLPNGETKNVRWYQFKIPVKEFNQRFGNIADFRSIRFMRMFLHGFDQEITLRFARLELIRGEWRKFDGNLAFPGPNEPDDPNPTIFNISAVNLEENAQREPINYVQPPGIIRETDLTTQRNINEQSLSFDICNLEDGDARAAYRNINFDMRLYKRLKMFVHAEKGTDGNPLNDGDISCFIRLGSDFTDNFYEYEIPLKVTDYSASTDEEIWPEENNFDIEFKKLQNLKIARPNGWPITDIYDGMDGNAHISIKGNPNLANVVTVMIGLRNNKSGENPFGSDDGLPKCAIVWVNELRLSDFDEKGGWAAVARMNTNLADFGTLQVAGNISKPGWGGLEQSILDRQRETIVGFDANSTLQLGKFFPDNFGIQLPMYLGFSQTISTPQYDPLSPDVEMDEVQLSPERKKSAQNFVKRRSINFTNVKINPKKKKDSKAGLAKEGPKGGKPTKPGLKGKGASKKHFYNISNFSVSYGYNELYSRDVNTEFLMNKQYTGAFAYAFSNKPKQIKPFGKIGFIKKSKYLKWLKDFNFYPGLKQVSFRTQMDRQYETSRIRNNTFALYGFESDALIQTQVMKNWDWSRIYGLKYDLTKSLKLDYNANNHALVGEPFGVIDRNDRDYYQAYKDTVWSNIERFGETTNFDQGINISYKLPFDKLPLVNFISSDARYGATFRWDRAPFSQDSLGNTIQNSRLISLNAQANMLNLYNKIPYLKDINRNKKKKKQPKKPNKDDVDGFGEEIEKEDKKKKGDFNFVQETLRFLMMLKNVSGSYSTNEGMLLPGYNRPTKIVGMDSNFEGPGVGFILGEQNNDIFGNPVRNYALDAAENGWINETVFQNQAHTNSYTQTWNLRANIEPIKYFKIEINGNKQGGKNNSSFFHYDEDLDDFVFDSPTETGNISISVNTWSTAFIKDDSLYNNSVFDQMLEYRKEMSSRLNQENYQTTSTDANGYYSGWGANSQDVVAPAFLAAYMGKSPDKISLNPFKTKVAPNWKITYDGLSRNKKFKKYFKRFSIKHNYQSTMSTSYLTNLSFAGDSENRPTEVNQEGNFITQKQVASISLNESMSPLIGFDMTIKTARKNEPNVKVELRKDRTAILSMTNLQITENKSNALVMGVGYKFKGIKNPFQSKKSKLPVQMLDNVDLQLRADLTIRDNSTVIRKVVENLNQVTAGQKIISLKTSADLNVSEKITLRFFYDQQLTRPKISNSFKTSNINSGISLRFTLS